MRKIRIFSQYSTIYLRGNIFSQLKIDFVTQNIDFDTQNIDFDN